MPRQRHVMPHKHVLTYFILGSKSVATGYLATGYPQFGFPNDNRGRWRGGWRPRVAHGRPLGLVIPQSACRLLLLLAGAPGRLDVCLVPLGLLLRPGYGQALELACRMVSAHSAHEFRPDLLVRP